jgi:hypothetical protein
MNEYQSMEMHHGAVDVLYPPRFELGSADGKVFDESAFHGGGIAFIDNENISFYVDKFKPHFNYGDADTDPEVIYPVFTGSENLGGIFGGGSAYLGHSLGPPVEIDLKYLNMLLNAKKLKASVSFDFSSTAENTVPTSFTSNVTSTGTIEGSFDKLELEIITDLSDPDTGLGHFARRYRRDISSKLAQLNPLSSPEFAGEINEYATESYAASAGGAGGSDSYPTYFRLREFKHSLPHALPRLTFIEDVRFFNIEDINYDDNYSYSYAVSESDVKSGNYSVGYDVTGNNYLWSSHSFGVGFILVTPTKVYAFPHINGRIAHENGGIGIGYTSIYSETYPAYSQGYEGEGENEGSINLPPVAVSTMNFLGVSIPIYFYYLAMNDAGTGPFKEYPTASCAGTSFDISVEEEW